ncbi:MAG: AMP-binding protein, partial [Pseudomonadota bacterium]
MSAIYSRISENAEQYPHKKAIIDADGSALSYREFNSAVQSAATHLCNQLSQCSNYNLFQSKSNPPVLLLASDSINSVVTVVALNLLGLSVAPMNAGLGIHSLRTAGQAVNAGAILHDTAYADKAARLATETCAAIAIDHASAADVASIPATAGSDDYDYLLTLSSGSTGDPKPVVYTDKG